LIETLDTMGDSEMYQLKIWNEQTGTWTTLKVNLTADDVNDWRTVLRAIFPNIVIQVI